MRARSLIFTLGSCCIASLASPTQVVLGTSQVELQSSPRQLHGRFLHITDIHPDPFYEPGASQSSACHRPDFKDERPAGYYGTPYSFCDSPFSLTNFTLDFLDEHWSSEIDFVIWTGDNARHDNDDDIPRTLDEIYDLNRAVAKRMEHVFLKKGIPVVPSLGNNDIWPHNRLSAGPNEIIEEFSSIWSAFIPPTSSASFHQGAYFSTEIIPDAVAAISLNTLYFYKKNHAVGGCDYTDPKDPGTIQLDWLEEQLEAYRSRQMQVWITGHVPPSEANYFSECYPRFVELNLRFQDTILGNLYGHLNVDHFSFLDADEINTSSKTSSRGTLFETLIADFSEIPAPLEDTRYDDYAVVNVNAAIVPNPYIPSFRIFTYNITGLSTLTKDIGSDPYLQMIKATQRRRALNHEQVRTFKKPKCEHKKFRNAWRCQPHKLWHSDSKSPSRHNSLWSPLGFAQFYMPRLEEFDQTHNPEFELEYMTFPLSSLHPDEETQDVTNHQYVIPLQLLPEELREPGVVESEYTPYELNDLTIPSWLDLATRLTKNKELRLRFKEFMYMGGVEE
ncbi:Metallo-dependent phosphatase-like protein [Suillus fuscotomentosus]|uniref:Endopolyphosphatase n=1 Tax=Suillus fuscotomentosus TaxID=1912939 RepID=A0AAD4DYJ7_9AGAM|nr:Metallo-dependent phosphatase-like protein [Suillus fuscotomentosus]KAG1896469.1 Metallo-dependent phosphatase-like protein [Suillus fuscotomentosus]